MIYQWEYTMLKINGKEMGKIGNKKHIEIKKCIINGNDFEKMEIEQWNEIKFQRWKQTGKDLGNMFQWKGKLQNWKRHGIYVEKKSNRWEKIGTGWQLSYSIVGILMNQTVFIGFMGP